MHCGRLSALLCCCSPSEYKDAAKRILKTLKPGSPSKCTINAGQYLYQSVGAERRSGCQRTRHSAAAASHVRDVLLSGACFSLSYIIESGVVYLCLAEKGYPKRLAYQVRGSRSRAQRSRQAAAVSASLLVSPSPLYLCGQYLEEVHVEFDRQYGAVISQLSRPYACVSFDPRMSQIRREFLDPHAPRNIRKLNSELADIASIMSANINDVLARGEKLDVMETRSQSLLNESKRFEKLGRYINIQALYKTYGPVAAVVLVVLFILYLRFFR